MLGVVTKFKNWVYSIIIDTLHSLLLKSTSERFTQLTTPINNYSQDSQCEKGILITTFEKRQFTSALPLIKQIRDAGIQYPIMVFLNGNLKNNHNQNQRKEFLRQLSEYDNVNIISSCEMTGISRNWNLGIQLLGTTLTVCLSDDLIISKHFKEELEMAFEASKQSGLITIEGFAAFVISRILIDELGWFDERFMGFGEEDGDYVWRYIRKFDQEPPRFKCHSILHQNLQTRGEEITGISKYSLFNLVWKRMKYTESDIGVQGMFSKPHKQRVDDYDYHPMETFRRANKHLFFETNEEIIESKIVSNPMKSNLEH